MYLDLRIIKYLFIYLNRHYLDSTKMLNLKLLNYSEPINSKYGFDLALKL